MMNRQALLLVVSWAGLSAFASGVDGKAGIEREIAAMEARNDAAERLLCGERSIAEFRDGVRVVSGTNVWTDAINAALKASCVVRIPKSPEPYFVDAPLVVPSNRKILAEGATIRLLSPCDTVLLRNAGAADGTRSPVDRSKGDQNIFVIGGRWEDWQTSRAGYGRSGRFNDGVREKGTNFYGVSSLLYFGNVSALTVRGATIANAGGFAIQCGDAKDVVLEDISFDRCHADGVHCNGNVSNVLVRNVSGDVGDDLVALNFYDWQDSSVNFGPGDTVLCENLRLRSGYPAIRLQPAVYRYADGTKVDCALRNVLFRNVRGVNFFKMYLQTPSYRIGTDHEWGEVGSAENIWFEDVVVDLAAPPDSMEPYLSSDPVRGHYGAFEIGANVSGLHLVNVAAALHVEKYPLAHLVCVGPKSVPYRDGGVAYEIFDPWVSCTATDIELQDVKYVGAAPSEPVHATVFDNVNGDGRSSGRGTVDLGTRYAQESFGVDVASGAIPGVINVFYKAGIQETSCMGYSDVSTKRRITLDDIFMQCSQTKGFCGVTVAMLVEEGKIALDDSVSKYLPEFDTLWMVESETNGVRKIVRARNELTIRHVMSHMGGLPFELPNFERMGGWNHRMPLRSVAAIAAALPLEFEPGTKSSYSNIGIDVGAAVVEVVSGKRWEVFLRERVFEPLGMVESTFVPTDAQLATKIESYCSVRGGTAVWMPDHGQMGRPYNDDRVFASAGAGLWTTARDQLKFYKMLMNLGIGDNGVRILKEETVKTLLARSVRPAGMGGYSLGLDAPEHDDEDSWFGHGGAWGSCCFVNWHKKELRMHVVQCGGWTREIHEKAAKAFFRRK